MTIVGAIGQAVQANFLTHPAPEDVPKGAAILFVIVTSNRTGA